MMGRRLGRPRWGLGGGGVSWCRDVDLTVNSSALLWQLCDTPVGKTLANLHMMGWPLMNKGDRDVFNA